MIASMTQLSVVRVGAWIVVAACLAAGGCTGSTSGNTSNCGKVAACGGNVVGTWKVADSCITSSTASMPNTSCPGETLQVASFQASGTLTLNADMTYTTALSTAATLQLVEPLSCLSSGTVTATCDQLAMGLNAADAGSANCTTSGMNCNCTSTFSQPTTTQTGTYSLSGTTVTITPANGTASTDSYCVQGSTLHVLSLPTSMTMGSGGVTASMDIVATKQ